MQTTLQAVVLKITCKTTPMYSLYTPTHGRLSVEDSRSYYERVPLAPGDICDVHIERKKSKWQLFWLEQMVTQGHSFDHHTLYWKHHLLDVYYCCVPLEQPSSELFGLLLLSMRLQHAPSIIWKAVMVQLFSFLGYGLPAALYGSQNIVALVEERAQACNTANVLHIDWQKKYAWSEREANEWLLGVMKKHAHYSLLRTRYILNELYGTAGMFTV